MDAIIDLITPRKPVKASVEEDEPQKIAEKEEEKPVKRRGNLVRSNINKNTENSQAHNRINNHRMPKNLTRPQSRGRSKENKFNRANSKKQRVPARAASHGYLRTTESYKSKRYVKNPQIEKRRTLAPRRELTKPTSIRLQTKIRSRRPGSIPALSQEERDDLFMRSLKPFKARNLSQKIMKSNGDLGIPRVAKRPTTEVKEFKFRTSLRASSRAQSLSRSKNSSENSSVATARNMRAKRRETKPRAPQPRVVSKPSMFQRSYERHMTAQRLQEQRKMEQEKELEESRVFKAQPLPDFSKVERFRRPAPKKPTIPITPKTLIKSRLSGELLKQKVAIKRVKQQREANFEASGLPDTTYSPEVVKVVQSKKSLTMAETPKFATDTRAIDRQMYDEQMKDIRKRQEKIQKMIEQRRKDQEKKELKEYRKTLIHRPLPLPATSVVEVRNTVE